METRHLATPNAILNSEARPAYRHPSQEKPERSHWVRNGQRGEPYCSHLLRYTVFIAQFCAQLSHDDEQIWVIPFAEYEPVGISIILQMKPHLLRVMTRPRMS